MKFSLAQLAALGASLILSQTAVAGGDASPLPVAERFLEALKDCRYKEAAAMTMPASEQESAATAQRLRRIGKTVGGFSTMRNVLSMPDGVSVKLEVPAVEDLRAKSVKYHLISYTATAADGQPVVYVLSIDGGQAQRVLSFAVHLPVEDAPSRERAQRIAGAIDG